jgi:hypothetical protein
MGLKYGFGCIGLQLVGLACSACAHQSLPTTAAPPQGIAVATDVPPNSVATFAAKNSSDRSESLEEREARALGRTWGWVLVGMGATAGTIAMGTSVLMLHDRSVRDAECNRDKACSASGLDANSQLRDLSGWNTGSWIVGAAGLGVGAYLLLTQRTDRGASTQIGVSPNVGGANLKIRAAF